MKKNDELEVLIEGYASDGSGIARPDGYVLFIPSVIMGERVLAHITKVGKSYGYAKAVRIIEPSKDRTEPICPVSFACGGCQMWHMSYESELLFKRNKVEGNLKKAGVDCTVSDTVPSPEILHYRNKAQYPIRKQGGKTVGGFYRKNSHTVIEGECAIQPRIFGDILKATLSFMDKKGISAYDETDLSGTVRHLYLRSNADRSQIMVCLVVKGAFLYKKEYADLLSVQFPSVCTICINYNDQNTNVVLGKRYETVKGSGYITDTLLGCTFEISPESFYQVNRSCCEKLYSIVKEAVKGSENLLDLYCGIGTIGLCVSGKAKLTGIEIVEKAIDNAKKNALLCKKENAQFIASDASKGAELAKGDYDTIIVDPPRKGCDKKTLEFLIGKKPKKLVYVSCDSATLARDLKILTEGGFNVQTVTPVDMFPRTSHVETVVKLTIL